MVITDQQREQALRERARSAECPLRKMGQCLEVSESLGWAHGFSLRHCDQCWRLGGKDSPDARQFRAHAVLGLLKQVLVPLTFGTLPPPVRTALLNNHCTPEEGALLMSHPDAQSGLKQQDLRAKVKVGWKEAAAALKSYKSRGVLNWTRADLTIERARHRSCFGSDGPEGEAVQAPCRALRTASDGIHHYCGECGCGEREDALLDEKDYPKLAFPYLECPLRRTGFSNEKVDS